MILVRVWVKNRKDKERSSDYGWPDELIDDALKCVKENFALGHRVELFTHS